jgi:hypothetical protein
MIWSNRMSKYTRWLGGLALLVALVGCGGGGGDGGGGGASAPVLPQGIWRASGDQGAVTAVVMPEALGGTVWAVGRSTDNTVSLFQANVSVSGQFFNGTGTALAVVSSTTVTRTPDVAVTLAAGVPAGATMAFSLNGESAILNYDSFYDGRASLLQDDDATVWSGIWISGRAGPGSSTIVTNWSVDNAGAITGSDTTGCVFSGALSLRPEAKAVVDVQLTEQCPDGPLPGVSKQFSGIGLPGVQAGELVGRLLILRRSDGQSFSILQWSAPPS